VLSALEFVVVRERAEFDATTARARMLATRECDGVKVQV
jgi:hypothetical protein